MENGLLNTIIASVSTGLFAILMFYIQKRANAKSDDTQDDNTESNTIKNLVESVGRMNTLYTELSDKMEADKKEADDKRKALEETIAKEQGERETLENELEIEREKRRQLSLEVQAIKDSFNKERKKLVKVIRSLVRQLKEAGITPDIALLDEAGLSLEEENNK